MLMAALGLSRFTAEATPKVGEFTSPEWPAKIRYDDAGLSVVFETGSELAYIHENGKSRQIGGKYGLILPHDEKFVRGMRCDFESLGYITKDGKPKWRRIKPGIHSVGVRDGKDAGRFYQYELDAKKLASVENVVNDYPLANGKRFGECNCKELNAIGKLLPGGETRL